MFEEYISSRMGLLDTESAFRTLAKAKAFEAQGHSIIHMEIGQPDFPTPPNIIEAAYHAMKDGHTGYTPAPGYPEARRAVAEYAAKYKGVAASMDDVIIVPGGKPTIFFAMQMLVENGDEVIYPNPSFPIYESCIKYCGGVPVPIPLRADTDFRFDPDLVRRSITGKTKLLILNNPCNPTGGVASRGDILAIADILAEHPGIFVLSDEMYDRLVYDDDDGDGSSSGSGVGSVGNGGTGGGGTGGVGGGGADGAGCSTGGGAGGGAGGRGSAGGAINKVTSIASVPGMKDRTIILDGLSKTYAMTGWRLGYGIMHPELVQQAELLAVNSFSCASAFTQIAAIEALQGPQDSVAEMLAEFRVRRDYLVAGLNAIGGIRCPMPRGAFYVFPDIASFGISSEEFADRLMVEGGVAASPGASYGIYGEGHIRLSYATSLENIKVAVERIAAFAAALAGR